jgi:uncharacterized repeat protein (TIGR03803 family)
MRKAQVLLILVCLSNFFFTPSSSLSWAATEKVLHAFKGAPDGANPQGILARDSAGNLYGVTYRGGKSGVLNVGLCWQSGGCGVVFELSPKTGGGWKETILHNFCPAAGCKDGANPVGGLVIDSAGNLFGATYNGGAHSSGVVFEMTQVDGKWEEKVIHSFCSETDCHDGQYPDGGLILDGAGNLYGTTVQGGDGAGSNGFGAAYELTPNGSGWEEKVLHRFCTIAFCPDGANPHGRLAFDTAGNLYGTAYGGGTGSGLAFKLAPTAKGFWHYTVLYDFCSLASCADGQDPDSGVTFDSAGNIFGTTYYGGANAGGVVYELVSDAGTWTESVAYSFCSDKSSGGTCLDGTNPASELVFEGSDIYGVTPAGGSTDNGVAYKLTPTASDWTETVIHDFCLKTACTDGGGPSGALLFDQTGNIYGVCDAGGYNNGIGGFGVVYEIVP